MSRRPVIGISTSTIIDQGGIFPGYHRTYVNADYIDAVIASGGIPMMIPLNTDIEILKDQISMCDALLISGGHDVYPLNYNQQPRQKLGDVYPERDVFEYKLLEYAEEKNIPVLGICRGLQIINTYYGGTLHQDLSYIEGKTEVIKHNQNQTPNLLSHSILTKEDSILRTIVGANVLVNSFHHQVIDTVAPNFKVSAVAPDGCVEAIESKGSHYIMGVQWHPEMLADTQENMKNIFSDLIKVASKGGYDEK